MREATAEIHSAIEVEADVERRLRDLTERPAMVGRFHRLHQAVEAAVAPWRAHFEADGYGPDRRSILILAGLDALGAPTPAPVTTRAPASYGEAMGWVYVAEGSMLGGRVMRKAMVRDGIPLTGLDFLDPWGDETGLRWRAFLNTMESAWTSGRAAQDDIVKGGKDAFDLAFGVLVPPAR
ncbi:biliverdin-producing heme oxygenase [Brevundimonas sp. FT23028]|uniref:biliverdin-producing heme oxygenase n=1 Tax=Brevundimonas sp. FT23028 TaxID=3393748 RepID=UPI003B588827